LQARARCPNPQCAAVFEIEPRSLGHNVRCPACGIPMTARTPEVAARVRAQQGRIAGGAGADVPRLPFAVVVDNVRSLWNVGSIFRTADACGVRELVLTGITGCPPRPQIAKTALGAERAVAWRYLADPLEAVAELAAHGYTAVALEASPRSVPVEHLEWPSRTCLVIGNEVAGVTPQLLAACPLHASIPMRGVKDSLNVAVAFGIAAHRACRALERFEATAPRARGGGAR
jgi:tRNA G18 (ribose-2'-O)-methylase SpoU